MKISVYSLYNKCDKKYYKQYVLVQLIAENVVTRFETLRI